MWAVRCGATESRRTCARRACRVRVLLLLCGCVAVVPVRAVPMRARVRGLLTCCASLLDECSRIFRASFGADGLDQRFVQQVVRDVGLPFILAAPNHYDTDDYHVHLVVGVHGNGAGVQCDRPYISRGSRERAQFDRLGRSIDVALSKQGTSRAGWTSRRPGRYANRVGGVVDNRSADAAWVPWRAPPCIVGRLGVMAHLARPSYSLSIASRNGQRIGEEDPEDFSRCLPREPGKWGRLRPDT